MPGVRLCSPATSTIKKPTKVGFFICWVIPAYLAGAAGAVGAGAATGAAASGAEAAGAGAGAAGAVTGAGLSQAVRAKAKRVVISAERIMINP